MKMELFPPARAALLQTRPKSKGSLRDKSGIISPDDSKSLTSKTPKELAKPQATPSMDEMDPSRNEIVIHCYDENRKVKKDFHCTRQALLRDMKYFSSYLDSKSSTDCVDIDVHCDIEVFEWLMNYIGRKQGKEKPSLGSRTVISILISSHFLQMSRLEDHCLLFCHEHMNEIIKVPIDLGCLNKDIISRLARLFSCSELDSLVDKKDKIQSQLLLYKMEQLLQQPKNALTSCLRCGKVYPIRFGKRLYCENSSPTVGFRGELTREHYPVEGFNVNRYIAEMHKKGNDWKSLFWTIWSNLEILKCTTCKRWFLASEINSCAVHSELPIFPPGETKGFYECCKKEAFRSHPFNSTAGCCLQDHTIDATCPMSQEIYERTLKHMEEIFPMIFDHSNSTQEEEQKELEVTMEFPKKIEFHIRREQDVIQMENIANKLLKLRMR